ncbi:MULTISPECIES: hypothetical protein [unclassified Halorhabdus]|uniref:hypothetical protein n=1 Tax=unclassified Halorhabdus TaxID=2621901 RepID=UPI001E332F64|nr:MULTISPECIES: hypothetical protein [unclassified Halorhabdus]
MISTERVNPGDALETSWASGEAHPNRATEPRYRMYHIGIGFTIVHVAVLLVATVPVTVEGAVLALPLLAVVGLGLFALLDSDTPHPGR